jgi:putative transposase
MPRTKRIIPVDFPLHIMVRGNNKQPIFGKDSDKRLYLNVLQDLHEQHEIVIYHYCLMNNHLHLLLQTRRPESFSRFMMRVNLTYFFYFNKKYGYVGHLFQNRFKSNIIDTDLYLLNCGKYIELNPVRAGLVARPEDYLFSSFRYYFQGVENPLLKPDPVYQALPGSDECRREFYRDLAVDNKMISDEKIGRHRFIGNDAFIKEMEKLFGLPNECKGRGRPRKEK